MPGSKWLLGAAIVVMTVGVILNIVGMATPQWLVCEYKGKTCHFDLWNNTECYDKKIKSVHPYEGEYPELTTVKGLVGTGLVSGVLAIASAIFSRTVPSDLVSKIADNANGITFIFVELAVCFYGGGVKDGEYGDPVDENPEKAEIENGFRLGYSFYLCLVAGFVMYIAGGLFYWWEEGSTDDNYACKMNCRGCLFLLAILLMFVGLALNIAGIATSEWLVCEYEEKTCYFDLWNNTECYDKKIKSVDPYEGEYPELTTVKGLVCTSLVSGVMAIASAILFCTFRSKLSLKIGDSTIRMTFLTIEIAVGVYGSGVQDGEYGDPDDERPEKALIENGFRLGYSWGLWLVAGFVMLIAQGIFYLWKVSSKCQSCCQCDTDSDNGIY